MARRARSNIELIVERLTEQGYMFHLNDDARTPVTPLHPPGPKVTEITEWFRRHFNAVPMTLTSWLRVVGDVWLVGSHPDWPGSTAADPLVIELEGSLYPDHSIIEYFAEDLFNRQKMGGAGRLGPFELPVAPDRLHKDNTSGDLPTASSFRTGARTAYSSPRRQCRSWRTCAGSSLTAGSPCILAPRRNGVSGGNSQPICFRSSCSLNDQPLPPR
jgi:hypothetical protein